jgi:mono/diheme cytochrome c family protein
MRRVIKALWHVCAILGIVTVAVAVWFVAQGISARPDPSPLEVSVARAGRHLAIPASERSRRNPIPMTNESVRAGLEHWADHCAACHANDGSGDDPSIGGALYPRAPDMRLPATQDLTDGELFYIIENGVKLTGMPAWGTGSPENEQDSWHLVNFIRHLPQLTDDELAEMEDLNPRGPADWRALEQERQFLTGATESPAAPQPQTHKGGHK